MNIDYHSRMKEYANILHSKIMQPDTDDNIVDYLIMLGKENIFIPVLVLFIHDTKAKNNLYAIGMLQKYINSAYNPGLRAQILDDFIRARLEIESKLNELKAKLGIYSMEQQLNLYKHAEHALATNATTSATHHILQVCNFRADDVVDVNL